MSEETKLEAMYYHMREARHVRWLEGNSKYHMLRTIGGAVGDAKNTPSTEDYELLKEIKGQPVETTKIQQSTFYLQQPRSSAGAPCVICHSTVYRKDSDGIKSRVHDDCWTALKSWLLGNN